MPPSCLPPTLHDVPRKKSKPIKIFSGVGHGIKKPKPKKPPKPPLQKKTPESTKPSTVKVREMMKEKFDFSRTPYALPVRRRVALSEECCKKRKFFRTTVEIETPQPPVPKKPKIDEPVIAFEFEDTNLIEEPELKDVFSILDDWDDDYVPLQPQLTRQKADELRSTETTHLSLSYLAPSVTRVSVTPNSISPSDPGDTSQNVVNSTPDQKDNSQNVVDSTPDRKDYKEGSESPETKLSKMFSVFTTPKKNVLSDLTNKNKKSKALDKAAAPNDQYQIDAGQKIIGPRECPNCGMVYDVGDPVDEKRHADYHKKRNDLKYKKSKSEDVVGICGADRIVRIRYSDEKKRDKVKRTLKVTEEDIGCGYTWGPNSVAFLYIRNDRIVGCLIAERKVDANRVIRSDGIVLLSPETHPVKCGVNRIWVKRDFRNNKIATEMMNCLRKNYLFGDYLKMDDIAFSATTPDGHAFAIKYTGRKDYLTYAGPPTQANS